MIRRAHGYVYLLCDDCRDEESERFDTDEFDEMLDQAREDGWRIRREPGGFTHYCPDCKET